MSSQYERTHSRVYINGHKDGFDLALSMLSAELAQDLREDYKEPKESALSMMANLPPEPPELSASNNEVLAWWKLKFMPWWLER
jgi:hypothetical protein